MNMLRKQFAIGIRSKLILSVVAVHVVLMTLFISDVIRRQQSFLLQEARQSSLNLVNLMAESASPWVMTEDVAGMSEVLQSSFKATSASYACIVAPNGLVLAHSNHAREGSFINDGESLELLAGPRETRIWRSDAEVIHAAAPISVDGHLLGWVLLGVDTGTLHAHLKDIRLDGVLYTLVAMLLGGLAAWLLAKMMFRQITLILQGVDRLRNNTLDTPIPVVNEDEIGRVAKALNGAMKSLRRSRDDLQKEILEHHRAEQRIHYLSRRLMEGSEEERKRLGHDLHDEFGQTVTGFLFGLHSLKELLDSDIEGARELCVKLTGYAEKLGDDIRRTAAHQFPIALEHLGLAIVAESFLKECASRHEHLDVTYAIDMPSRRLDAHIELTGYRILQEAVSNVTRHSGAKRVEVALCTRDNWVMLHVQDDGHGFDVQETMTQGQEEFSGIGLIGMQERAVSVGGHLEVTASPGKGCTVEAFLPLRFKTEGTAEKRPEEGV